MRKLSVGCLAVMVVLLGVSAVRADDRADCLPVIDKAIKASGGAEKLAKYKAETVRMKGKFYGMGDAIPYEGEWAVMQPDKMRFEIVIEVMGQRFTIVHVVNGNNGWRKVADMLEELDKDQLAELQEELYADRVLTLVDLKDPAFTLTPLGESKVGGKVCVGVRVASKDHRDISLYFDKESSLPVKAERRVRDETGQEANQEELYSDFKDVDGVKIPMKLVINRDGKLYIDGEATEVKLSEKLDDNLFVKP